MSTNPSESILIPPPVQIRERLAAAVAEARALRKLLRLAEAAAAVKMIGERQRVANTEGRRRE